VSKNSKARRDEVWPLTGSSYALRRLGRVAESKHRIETALANLRSLNAYPAARIELGDESDAALRALADHYADTGQTGAAVRTYEELHEKVLAANPQPMTDLRHANGLSRIYRDLANVQLRVGRAAAARTLHQRRVELWRHWNAKLPNNAFVRRELAAANTL
jgi:hypothetical protein